jgi:hypothetical protein
MGVLPHVLRPGMTINSDELVKALQENLKLRRGLATQVAGGKVRYRSTRVFGALRQAFSGRISRASVSAAIMAELMTLDGAREQYAAQLRQLDREGLLKEIEQLRRLLTDLPPPRERGDLTEAATNLSSETQT